MHVKRTPRSSLHRDSCPQVARACTYRGVIRRRSGERLDWQRVHVAGRKLEVGRRADAAWRQARQARAEAWIRRAGWSATTARNVLGAIFCLGWLCFAALTLVDSSIPEGVLRSQYRAVWGWLLLVLLFFPIAAAVGGWTVEWIGRGLQHGLRWVARRWHIDLEA